jgi:TolA-binding protein
MNAIRMITAIIVLSIPLSIFAQAQEKKKEKEEDLAVVADEMKFQNGLQLFELREYGKSLVEFSEYLEIYRHGIHRKEAYMRIAGIHFDAFEYEKAARFYHACYEEFPGSEEGVEAYYRVGICYGKMGFDKKAREIFSEIIRIHSGSNYSYNAKLQMDLMDLVEER